MRDEFLTTWFDDGGDPARHDPIRAARAALKPQWPKRFYAEAAIRPAPDGHALTLDGKPARTRAGRPLVAPSEKAGALLAAEWAAQGEFIVPPTMPVTRILHAAIDHVAEAAAEVAADILSYAGTDLVCYRAGDPERLVALQRQHWDPVLGHARARYGANFHLAEGIMHVAQPPEALAALEPAIAARRAEPAALAALHVLTTISGSALIAINVADGALEAEAGFDAGEVDSDFEVSVWGGDDEAAERRAARRADFLAAAVLLAALGG